MTPLLAALLVAALMTLVIWVLSSPFRRSAGTADAASTAGSDERRALEAAREAKYAEIRDNETDYRTGKLSTEDYRAIDQALRREAVEVLRELDRLGGAEAEAAPDSPSADGAPGARPTGSDVAAPTEPSADAAAEAAPDRIAPQRSRHR